MKCPPLSKCEILILESSEHTDDRIHFTEVIETVSDVPRCIWEPLTRNSGLRSDHETTKSMVRLQKLCRDVCLGILRPQKFRLEPGMWRVKGDTVRYSRGTTRCGCLVPHLEQKLASKSWKWGQLGHCHFVGDRF